MEEEAAVPARDLVRWEGGALARDSALDRDLVVEPGLLVSRRLSEERVRDLVVGFAPSPPRLPVAALSANGDASEPSGLVAWLLPDTCRVLRALFGIRLDMGSSSSDSTSSSSPVAWDVEAADPGLLLDAMGGPKIDNLGP